MPFQDVTFGNEVHVIDVLPFPHRRRNSDEREFGNEFQLKCDRISFLHDEFWQQVKEETELYRVAGEQVRFGSFLQAKLSSIKQNLAELDQLHIASKSITPLLDGAISHKSTGVMLREFLDECHGEYLKRGQSVHILGSWSASNVVSAFQPMLTVRTPASNKQINVPSVYVRPIGSDQESVDRTIWIYEGFLDVWRSQIDDWLSLGLLHFSTVLEKVTKYEEITFENRQRIREFLDELESAFPQIHGSPTNAEILRKTSLARAELRNSEEGSVIARDQASLFCLVARTQPGSSEDISNVELDEEQSDQLIQELEHLASEVELLGKEISSNSAGRVLVQKLKAFLTPTSTGDHTCAQHWTKSFTSDMFSFGAVDEVDHGKPSSSLVPNREMGSGRGTSGILKGDNNLTPDIDCGKVNTASITSFHVTCDHPSTARGHYDRLLEAGKVNETKASRVIVRGKDSCLSVRISPATLWVGKAQRRKLLAKPCVPFEIWMEREAEKVSLKVEGLRDSIGELLILLTQTKDGTLVGFKRPGKTDDAMTHVVFGDGPGLGLNDSVISQTCHVESHFMQLPKRRRRHSERSVVEVTDTRSRFSFGLEPPQLWGPKR
uniref:ANK_REP_REGION domain-containing protein n=1 Tax=Mesocestoides corti TaxID=53468 RepID=A0A5K3FZ63_MESCO